MDRELKVRLHEYRWQMGSPGIMLLRRSESELLMRRINNQCPIGVIGQVQRKLCAACDDRKLGGRIKLGNFEA